MHNLVRMMKQSWVKWQRKFFPADLSSTTTSSSTSVRNAIKGGKENTGGVRLGDSPNGGAGKEFGKEWAKTFYEDFETWIEVETLHWYSALTLLWWNIVFFLCAIFDFAQYY